MTVFRRLIGLIAFSLAAAFIVSLAPSTVVHGRQSSARPPAYDQLKAFSLGGGTREVSSLVLKRDRVEMTFTGTFYFATPIDGNVTGAVFIGTGTMKADVPPADFERDNVKRLLGADTIDSDFKTAVLRMTDDTFNAIGSTPPSTAPAPAQAQKLATELEPRLLLETGVNLSARLATSLLNKETPGVFFAQFDGGRRGRFSYALDNQTRIPVSGFGINAGEKGLIFAYQPTIFYNEVWTAFFGEKDYAAGAAAYADANDLVDVTHYNVDVNLTDVAKTIGVRARMDLVVHGANVRAIPFKVGEALSTSDSERLKFQMRVKGASIGGKPIAAVQEDWEGGFTVFPSTPLQDGEKVTLEVDLDGNFMVSHPLIPQCYYLLSNDTWVPRHGYLDRATWDLTFRTAKRHKVASAGLRTSEEPDPENKDVVVTRYKMDVQVPHTLFVVGPFQRFAQTIKFETDGTSIPLEFTTTQAGIYKVKETFILDELNNSVRYFAAKFGKYPYSSFGAAFHPFNFGQGFPSFMVLAPADSGTPRFAYQFLSHETAHQWWGGAVAWRSYQDQWLSEGFAQYSSILYAAARDTDKTTGSQFIREARDELLAIPRTPTGVGKGRLVDIGPIILGSRLNTTKSGGAYQALIYEKGAMVLRMLHFLFSDPNNPADDKAFWTMMGAFVERHRNGSASTNDFFRVANEHFVRTPIAQRHSLPNLNWFQFEWVRRSDLPLYAMEYEIKPQPDGKVTVAGTIRQDNVPAEWIMPIPVVFTFEGNQVARTTVLARGPSTPFELSLPTKPNKVELDPDSWVLSEKTTTKGK
jgi:hypothetical protein